MQTDDPVTLYSGSQMSVPGHTGVVSGGTVVLQMLVELGQDIQDHHHYHSQLLGDPVHWGSGSLQYDILYSHSWTHSTYIQTRSALGEEGMEEEW